MVTAKSDLISAVAEKAGVTKKDTTAVLEALVYVVPTMVASGQDVRLYGFGTFTSTESSPRIGRNPSTGEQITIPAKRRVRFRPGAIFKEIVNDKPVKKK